jgi:Tol biopolymer transport system component
MTTTINAFGDIMKRPRIIIPSLLLGVLLSISCAACGRLTSASPKPTPDYPALETRAAVELVARLTARAPTATPVPTPEEIEPTPTSPIVAMPTMTITPEPAFFDPSTMLAYVRQGADQATNIVMHDIGFRTEELLTHFVEPQNIHDLKWSRDGQWLIFISSHNFVRSRNGERNIFMIQPDGTGLRMITGAHIDPEQAPGPYVALRGTVTGAEGSCLVYAQGASSPITTNADGSFELGGVPVSARWARAVCQVEDRVRQGDVDLSAVGDAFGLVNIEVAARGEGWRSVSLSYDGTRLAAVHYTWSHNDEGERVYTYDGALYDLDGNLLGTLELPEGTTLISLDWSPVEDKLVGALRGAKSTSLWQWDVAGKSLGGLIEIEDAEDTILTAAHPVWSPDGSQVAFELRCQYWWGDAKYRTDLLLVPATGGEVRVLLESEWGVDARYPAWTADGSSLYYQVSEGEPGQSYLEKTTGSIWWLPIADPAPAPWASDGISYMPAAGPPMGSGH